MQFLNSTSLIRSIKRRGLIPTSQNTFTDQDFIDLANEEMDMGMTPYILQYHEDYFLTEKTVALTGDVSAYPIPYRAIGNKLRDISFVDSQGQIFEMTRINKDDEYAFQNTFLTSQRAYYYIQGSDIILVPRVTSTITGNIKFSYYLRPNQLVLEERVAFVTNIDRTTGVITLDTIPSVFTVSSLYDFLSITPPFKTYSFDKSVIAINTTAKTMTFDPDDIPDNLQVDDYICLTSECFVPQTPPELHSMLAERVVNRVMEALGDQQGMTLSQAKIQDMELKGGSLLDDRVEGSPKKVLNLHSILRFGRRFRRRNQGFY